MDNRVKIVPVKKEYIESALDISVKAWEPIRKVQKELMGEEIYNVIHNNWQEIKKQSVKAYLERGEGFIALCDDTVAGFVTYKIIDSISCGEILNNAVSGDFRGMGIAGAMHNEVLKHFKNCGLKYAKVETGLDEGHLPARKAYGKVGFEVGLPHVVYYMKLDRDIKKEVYEDIEILPYEEKYLDEIFSIALSSWDVIHNEYKKLIGDEIHDGINSGWEEKLKNTTENLLKNEKGFVALVDGKVAGYATYRKEEEKKLGIFAYNSVSQYYRGKRISSRLYNHLKCEMVKEGLIYAKVTTGLDDGHAPARRAYEKAGFGHPVPSITYYKKLD